MENISGKAALPLLEMRGIVKEFPGVRALDEVDLTVREGSVHALMGENGAGKSTLMKCLFGIYEKDAGEIIAKCRENGVLVIKAKNKIRLLPALNIPMETLRKALDVIKTAL